MTEPRFCLPDVGLDQEACLDQRDVNGRVKALKGDAFLYFLVLLWFFREELVSDSCRSKENTEPCGANRNPAHVWGQPQLSF